MSTHRSSRLRIRNVFVAIAALVILQVFSIFVSGVSARESTIDGARDGITREARTTTQSILRYLEPAEQSVEVTARLLGADLIDRSAPGLEQYLFTQLAVMPQMTGAFVGYPNGEFVFVSVDGNGYRAKRIVTEPERSVTIDRYDRSFTLASTEVVFDDDYDPRARPWYEDALSTDMPVWTDPYVFFSSQQPGVTASAAVRVGGDLIAVVGVDVELSGLATFLDDLNFSDQGEAFVVSGETVIGAPSSYGDRTGVDDDGNLRLLTTTELGVPQLAAGARSVVQRIDTGSGIDLALHRDFPDEQGLSWSVVVRAPEHSFTATTENQQRTMLFLTIGGGLVVLAGALILVRVSRPIEQVEEWALTDSLTGLANRRAIDAHGAEMLAAVEAGDVLAVMVLDLDGFKGLNDTHGHHAGDTALREVGRFLGERFRGNDLVGRLGGDEFVIVQSVRDADAAVAVANRVMEDVRAAMAIAFPEAAVGVSAGLTVGSPDEAEFAELLLEADATLLAAKSEYKGMLRLADRLVPSSL